MLGALMIPDLFFSIGETDLVALRLTLSLLGTETCAEEERNGDSR